ncbi:MAG TPA: DUF2071 domain-containing protein [Polyangiaceae bacterium]|jgi:hypothetical protein
MDRLEPGRQPEGSPAGTQKWRRLLFLHWEVPVARLRALVPEPLAIDTFEGRAYVGVVAFEMHDVRPSRFLPAVPTARQFEEVNVRTYVHLRGERPGVWFFSLDAASALAVLGARAFFHLPYYHARMHTERDGDGRIVYRSERNWEGGARAAIGVRYETGDDLGPAREGTFEHFLAERYYLYARTSRGTLLRGQVHHMPYPLREARVLDLDESLVAAAEIPRPEERVSELWSPGVDVEIYRLKRC